MFRIRSNQKELLDEDSIGVPDLKQNLDELHTINRHLGGYKASGKALQKILSANSGMRNILDIGFGGGGSIRYLADSFHNKKGLFFFGVDIKQDCMEYADTKLSHICNKFLMCNDYRNLDPGFLQNMDVVHCSLFLHHLTDEEIITLFNLCRSRNCVLLVNDLHRHWLAYYSIKILTFLFSRSRLVKNDAPLSVRRGFKRQELVELLRKSGFVKFSVTWSWAFRYIIIAEK